MTKTTRKQVLILGGGFGGLYTALHLEDSLAAGDVDVTLINRENCTLFTPMLHEVAASDLDFTHIVNPLRKMLKRVQFFHGNIESIDLEGRRVSVVHGPDNHMHDMPFDYLVIALGAVTNFFGNASVMEHCMTIKSLSDAIHLRNRLIDLLEEADADCALGIRSDLLTVVVAGGGFAGTETIAGINDFLRDSVCFYKHLTGDMIRVVLVHPGDVILPELGPELGAYAQKKLAERKVEIHVKTRVESATAQSVLLNNGMQISAHALIWAAGTAPNPLIASLPCKMDKGRLIANEFLEVEGVPNIWVLGDCASVADPKSGHPYPPTAQHALRQGKTVAANIVAALRGGKKKAFAFSTLGLLASIGKRTGVANILGVKFSGFVAWFLWRTIYLSKLPRFEKKLRVAFDWTLDLFFSKDLVHFLDLRVPTRREISESQEVAVVSGPPRS